MNGYILEGGFFVAKKPFARDHENGMKIKYAGLCQLVDSHLAMVEVASSSLVSCCVSVKALK